MKKIIFTLVFSLFVFSYGYSQCKEFVMNEVFNELDDFLLTGKYHSMELSEGEEVLIFKTVNQGLQYRFIIKGDNNISQPNFLIVNNENNVVFNNYSKDGGCMFDFKPNETQKIKIIIKIPKSSKTSTNGCVGLVIGVKNT